MEGSDSTAREGTDRERSESANNWQELVNRIDVITKSPLERAKLVHAILKDSGLNVSQWDTLCYSVENLNMAAEVFPFLKDDLRHLNRYLYLTHYLKPDEIGICQPEELSASDRELIQRQMKGT